MAHSTCTGGGLSLGLVLGFSIFISTGPASVAAAHGRGPDDRDRSAETRPSESVRDARSAVGRPEHEPHGFRWGWRGQGRPHGVDVACEARTRHHEQDRHAHRRGHGHDRHHPNRHHAIPDANCETPPPDPDPEPDPVPDPEPSIEVAPPPMATLYDIAGAPFADLGTVDVDDALIQVPGASGIADPIVILGPATRLEADPGVVRLDGVAADGFRVRFEEWSYLDGIHADESVAYLVLAPGRHRTSDGSDWEVGSIDVDAAGSYFDHAFSTPFTSAPMLFLTVQTHADEAPVVVRARGVTTSGFQLALQEEEGADGIHSAERVGYLAIASPAGSGTLDASMGALSYWTRAVTASDRFTPVLSGALALEEETSADSETTHIDESLSFLAVGSLVFAQAMTDTEPDPVSIRRRVPALEAQLEWGTASGVDHNWQTIPLARRYVDPIVVVGPASANGPNAGLVRVRNRSADAFELRFQEWAYLDDVHSNPERVFYLVAERGLQSVAGLMLQADSVETSMNVADGLVDVPFGLPFPTAPGIFASVSTVNDPAPATVRLSDRTSSSFRVALQAEEAATTPHGAERIDWVAIQRGEGMSADGRVVRVLDTQVGSTLVPMSLGTGLRGPFPSMLAQMQSLFGGNPATMRFSNLGPDRVELIVQEEQSADEETDHREEDVSVFIAE